jgi:tRNA threonylcarbamoyl adenosine modification protein (Sua5/YciO/YrdC/YwlC family)
MILKIHPDNPQQKSIDTAAEILRDGGVIIYPTDTVYALGCDIFQARAIERIYKYRGIEPSKARLSFICSNMSQLSEFAKVDNNTFKLMKRLLPGPYTFILNRSNRLPKLFRERATVGIRIPDNLIARTLIDSLGNPILSASLREKEEEQEYITDPELIDEKYENQVDAIIDGGFGDVIPSTVIDCTSGNPVILRQGKGKVDL